jgi:hypothetical protein
VLLNRNERCVQYQWIQDIITTKTLSFSQKSVYVTRTQLIGRGSRNRGDCKQLVSYDRITNHSDESTSQKGGPGEEAKFEDSERANNADREQQLTHKL